MLQVRREAGDAGQVVVAVGGQVDLATAPQLADELTRSRQPGIIEVVVDLTEVDFLDSAGVRVLVEAAQDATQREVKLSVRGAQSWVARVLEITGVDEFLRVVR